MTLRRATLYLGVSAIAAAWLSSAAWSSTPEDPPPIAEPAPPTEVPRVVERTARLQARMDAAPRPRQSLRNPFEFHRSQAPGAALSRRAPRSAPEAADPAPDLVPPVTLIGIAERKRAEGTVRTAVFATAGGDLVMAGAGDVVLDRYTVTTVDAGSVTMTDAQTGARLELRFEGQ